MKQELKAKELMENITEALLSNGSGINKQSVKACAIIAVDEILKSYEETNSHYGTVYKYWQSVKKEIQNL